MLNVLTLLSVLLSAPAQAGELSSVKVPDTVTVGGKSLVLNGMGLREKFFIDIYVGSLYLPAKTSEAKKVIEDDVPKRIDMNFIYSEVPKDKLTSAYVDGFAAAKAETTQKENLATLNGWMETVNAGDVIRLDYVPGTGTTVYVKGTKKGTIAGADFMKALWSVYVGSAPPTSALKKGMLGN